jgi:ubiquinone/menaquinone biosynthesis C-methylase UbiE
MYWNVHPKYFKGSLSCMGRGFSIEMLKQAKLKLKHEILENVTFARADAYKLPFSEDQFNGVSCIGAMQLFSDTDEIVTEIKRVMKDSATLVVMTYVKEGVWKEKEHQEYLEKVDIHFFEVEEIEKLLEQNGFENFLYKIDGSMIMFSCTANKE